MKKMIFGMALGIIFLTASALAENNGLFKQANEKYSAGDYTAAAVLYEKVASLDGASSAVYYNLGNAYFRAGQKGRAMVYYERAGRLDPRDQDIEWNRGVLKNALTDRIEDVQDNVFISSVQRLLEWITLDEAALVFAAILLILFIISAVSFFSHKPKSLTAGIGGLLVFLWICSLAVYYFKWTQVRDPQVVVLDREVAARYGPSDKETKAFVLHEGAQAVMTDQTGEWYYILLKNKNTAWVPKKSCEIV